MSFFKTLSRLENDKTMRRPQRLVAVEMGLVAAMAFLALAAFPPRALGADGLGDFSRAQLQAYRELALACEQAYDDAQPDLVTTPAGCVALVREDGGGNLVIAFRGSMLGDRNPEHAFSNLGGANIRRNYRDWVATNLKQTTGFLPRQYVEAAELVGDRLRKHPVDKYVLITGHSKGGGAATYASVAARISPEVSPEQAARMRVVTFNAAVVREQNWRRLFRRTEERTGEAPEDAPPRLILAFSMADDPVSRIGRGEERNYVRRVVIEPAAETAPTEQHAIRAVIRELEKAMGTRP